VQINTSEAVMKKQGFEPNTRLLIVVSKFLHGASNASIAITSKWVKAMSMTKKKRTTFCLMVTFLLMVLGSLSAKDPNSIKHARGPLNKGVGLPISTLSNVNNISMWIRADGWSARNPGTGGSGGIFPRGIPAGVIFADGLVWTGLVQDGQTPVLRAGGQTYAIGTVPGRIISRGVAEDPDASDVRIWRVRRDYPTADLRQDAADLLDVPLSNVTSADEEAVRTQYRTDWEEWPAEKGAPFYDADGDGIYTPQFDSDNFTPILFPDADEPGIADADQIVWFVANDLTDGAVRGLYGSPSIGLEMQVTLWAYDFEHTLNTAIFKRYRLIYKGTSTTPDEATIDSMFIAQWSDPDLGSFGDDFVGVDILLSLGYVYNSSEVDSAFLLYGLSPPAAGYVFLQGPIVESPGDTATFDFGLRPGFRNLPMTSFAFFAAGTAITDPPLGNYEGTLQWRNLHFGLTPAEGIPFFDPNDPVQVACGLFTLCGNPVTGEGWIDSGQADRRMVLNTGPFSMALGDTQEVVIALVAAMGEDYLNSITDLRNNAEGVLTYFNGEIITNVDDNSSKIIINSYTLRANYPNPFNPVTTIEYTLPKSGEVNMIVYNLLGQEVTRIIDEVQQAGYHKVTWDASNFASGIYFYRLQAGDFVRTRKMVLLK